METSFANQVVERCGSTNDLAKQLAEAGFEHGTWTSARLQDSGRGRLGRKWESAVGNLFLSVILRIQDKALWTWVPLTVSVGVVQYFRKYFSKGNDSEHEFRVKWPNDIWLGGRKLGGILCEGSRERHGAFIVAGVGINCQTVPKELERTAVDLSTFFPGENILVDEIREGIITNILAAVKALEKDGSAQMAALYDAWAEFPKGTEVEWGSPLQSGFVQGLGPSGELQVQTNDKTLKSLFAEDVKLRLKKRNDLVLE